MSDNQTRKEPAEEWHIKEFDECLLKGVLKLFAERFEAFDYYWVKVDGTSHCAIKLRKTAGPLPDDAEIAMSGYLHS
ncbi:MAG: hypothetical protein KGQ79_05880 [Proteobacteria bacterium]|nr:hypothetical protein [Pseudomonadota bacterium]